jgi:RNase P subunit RPR2
MPQHRNVDPLNPMERPLCSNCGWPMWITRVEPHELEQEHHVYKCERCEIEEYFPAKM